MFTLALEGMTKDEFLAKYWQKKTCCDTTGV
jgi:ribosomal protein L16 Arg81 hydroxylase